MKTGTDINYAAELLRKGKVVAIPTETVYGLAANAFDHVLKNYDYNIEKDLWLQLFKELEFENNISRTA